MAMAAKRPEIDMARGEVIKKYPGQVAGPGTDHINTWVREVWEEVGDVTDFTVFPTDIIVAYWDPKAIGSIQLAPQSQRENRFQAKCGFVLRLGAQAFVDGDDAKFHGFRAAVGDWVVFNYNDGREIGIVKPGSPRKFVGRTLKDGEVSMIIPRPDRVW